MLLWLKYHQNQQLQSLMYYRTCSYNGRRTQAHKTHCYFTFKSKGIGFFFFPVRYKNILFLNWMLVDELPLKNRLLDRNHMQLAQVNSF